mmetsp:Transcript_20035/g.33913  ORF Transcript_20035/g.33913 Transcript_20035/m.33913 type:complete len:607 (-) Transcript_20035:474-2294(-)
MKIPPIHFKTMSSDTSAASGTAASDTAASDQAGEVAALKKELADTRDLVKMLADRIKHGESFDTTYAASSYASIAHDFNSIPLRGMPAKHVASMIEDVHLCDFNPLLNTSSYVNVTSEPEEKAVAAMGAQINIADASVYPASIELHDKVVNMIATMWNAPEPANGGKYYAGAGTVGSTEGCLLAGLALKFRWRAWYKEKHGLSDQQVLGVRPNLVISSIYQAAWEKFFRFFDVEAKVVKPNLVRDKMAVNAHDLVSLCDEKTIAVVGILGNHYNGMYDPIWEIDEEIEKLNAEKGWQIGIHVDGASGGFIAPFQEMSGKGTPAPYDFRLKNVLTMSGSGHKFGESICGTGWVVFRQREGLASHVATTVTYLGGSSDSLTLNFSRPASGPYVQFYKLLRLGQEGYMNKVENQMGVTSYLRHFLSNLKHPSGKPRFQILDGGDTCCLPVVAARLNPELNLHYDDIDLQHCLSESHWYVSGYSLGFENPMNDKFEKLCNDVNETTTMFRIVVKSNLTRNLAENLAGNIEKILSVLDDLDAGYESIHSRLAGLAVKDEEDISIQDLKEFSDSIGELPSRGLNKSLKSQFIQQSFRKKKQKRSSILAQNIC